MPYQSQPDRPAPTHEYADLHREYFVRETLDVRKMLGHNYGDHLIYRLSEDHAKDYFFSFSVPSLEQARHVSKLPEQAPERLQLHKDIREALNRKEQAPILISLRKEDGLSVSVNYGLGDMERSVTLLFDNVFYRITQESYTHGELVPTYGLVSVGDNHIERQAKQELPPNCDLTELLRRPFHELRIQLQGTIFYLERLCASSLIDSEDTNHPPCYAVNLQSHDSDDSYECRFSMNPAGQVNNITVLGPSYFFEDRVTVRSSKYDEIKSL